jgi:hypothetical protein
MQPANSEGLFEMS